MPRHPKAPPVFPAPWAKDWGQDQYGLWMSLVYKNTPYVFRWIPPGEFMMGSSDDGSGQYDDEDLHEVTVTEGFWLGDFPVTQMLYQAVTGENPSFFKDSESSNNLPVEQVSWQDAQVFIQTLNQAYPGLNTYLPLETQWEYACLAGSLTTFEFDNLIDLTQANYRGRQDTDGKKGGSTDNRLNQTNVKGNYPVNPWGLYDMHGNVREWCLDPWMENLGTDAVRFSVLKEQAKTLEKGLQMVQANQIPFFSVRGGSWASFSENCRSAYRDGREAGSRLYTLGFRLSLGPELQ